MMFGFGKKKREKEKKKALVEAATSKLEGMIGLIEAAQAEGKEGVDTATLGALATTVANLPDRPDLWERVKKIALAKGLAVVKKDNIVFVTKPNSDLLDRL